LKKEPVYNIKKARIKNHKIRISKPPTHEVKKPHNKNQPSITGSFFPAYI